MRTRKGQAATEFLSTYGIAIMAVLLIAGILAYFGYLNPGRYAPSECTFGSQIVCDDHILTEDTLRLTITNALKDDIIIKNVTSETLPLGPCFLPSIPTGQRADIACQTETEADSRLDIDIGITYQRTGGPEHTVRGRLQTISRSTEDPFATCPDADTDSYVASTCGGNDCNDQNPTIHPDATDYCAGNKDEDCDLDFSPTEPGCTSCDADGDGDQAKGCLGSDCRDDNENIWFNNPNNYCDCRTVDDGIGEGTIETQDGIDNDCDGTVDEGTAPIEANSTGGLDDDGDGCIDAADGDCGGTETGGECATSIDDDCDGQVNCMDTDCTPTTGTLSSCLQCEDTIKSGSEPDVDCGSICQGCADTKGCNFGKDCQSLVCESGVCVSCQDNIKNQDETGTDCGGTDCAARCGPGAGCLANNDCTSNICCPSNTCAILVKKIPTCIGT